MQPTRHLAAILFTDIVGSTAIMQKDEQTALSLNKRYIAVLKQTVSIYGGEIVNDYGDGSLCTFTSATQAVRCAIEMQQQFRAEPVVPLRIGLHVGEVFFDEGKVFGDGVNVASRIQSLGIANSVLFSSQINNQIKNQQEFKSVSVGKFEFKNVDEPMEVFALSNDGLIVPRKEEMSGKLKEIQKQPARRKWIATVLAVPLLIASYFIYENFFQAPRFSGEKTIAVLPFENIGMADSEEYISDGITQDIIGSLSKVSSLKKVIGWFSVKEFKKTTKPLNEIANKLDVAAILSGTIQTRGNKTRIVAELIEVATKKRLWGDDFEYDSTDMLTIQSKVAGQIVSALKASITPEEEKELSKQYTANPEAYKLYRKGLSLWNKQTQPDFDSAELYYKRALDIDPDYALPYTGLANCYIFSRKIANQLEGIPVARAYTLKALSLDSNLSEALTTLGWIQGVFDYDWVQSKITLQKAIRLNPNYADAHLFYGNLLQYTGENTELGIAEVKKALESDPLNIRFNWVLGRNYYFSNQDELAIEQLRKTIILNPHLFLAKAILAQLYLKKKMYPDAFELISQMPKIPIANYDGQSQYLCFAYAISGDTSRAKSLLESTLKKYPDQSPIVLAYIYIALKNYGEALNMMEAGYKVRDIRLYWVKVDPVLAPIRNEPRFKALLKKMNLD